MLISSYINFPFGRWAYCQYPAVVEARSSFGKIEMGSDLLLWIGQLEVVLARDARKAAAWSPRPAMGRLAALLGTPRLVIGRAPVAPDRVIP